MFENLRRGRQARNFTTNVSKILDLKSSSEQIFFRKLSLGAPGYSPKATSVFEHWNSFSLWQISNQIDEEQLEHQGLPSLFFFSGSSSTKGRMFKKSLSYNVAPWLIAVDQKNQNIRSSFEDRPLCYVLFCLSLFSLSFYLLDPMEDEMTFRQSWSMLLRCTPATVSD